VSSARRCVDMNKEIEDIKKKIAENELIIEALRVLKREKLKELKRLIDEK
jgi:hypothetical protein